MRSHPLVGCLELKPPNSATAWVAARGASSLKLDKGLIRQPRSAYSFE
jgi:hypothetical protein